MAKVQPVTAYGSHITGVSNTTFTSVAFPFTASRTRVALTSATSNPTLELSLDGVNVAAVLHNFGEALAFTFEQQRIGTLYYRVTAGSCSIAVNAEQPAYPNPF